MLGFARISLVGEYIQYIEPQFGISVNVVIHH